MPNWCLNYLTVTGPSLPKFKESEDYIEIAESFGFERQPAEENA